MLSVKSVKTLIDLFAFTESVRTFLEDLHDGVVFENVLIIFVVFNSRDHWTNRFSNVEVILCPESININFSLLFLMIPCSTSFLGLLFNTLFVLFEAKRKSSFVSIDWRLPCHQSL